jgi:uncharacterized RDD family membrane protein YckC
MRCVRCGKEQLDRAIQCPYCGNRLQRESKETNETAATETSRPTLIEFPATQQRSANRNSAEKRSPTVGPMNGDWRAELSARVKQVKERRNLEEARGRLQAELEAAAQRYHQANAQPIVNIHPAMPNESMAGQAAETVDRPETEGRHPNPIIDAALKRARRATEVAIKRQQVATAAAPKMPPQVLQAKPKQAEIAMALPEQEQLTTVQPEQAPAIEIKRIEKPVPVISQKLDAAAESSEINPFPSPTPVLDARPRLLESKQPTPSVAEQRPIRIIKESDAGPNYLDELIVICEQNLSNEHARYSQRTVAAVIDLSAVALFSSPYWLISYAMNVNFTDEKVLILLGSATLAIAIIYLTLATRMSARTLGMIFVGTRIINTNTGAPPSSFQALLRSFGYILSTAVLGLGFLWMFLDREKRGLHDLISGTSVVREY